MFLSRRAQGAAKGGKPGTGVQSWLILKPAWLCFRDGDHRGADLSGLSILHHSAHSHAYSKGCWMNEKDLVNGQVKDGCTDGEMVPNGRFSIKTPPRPEYTSHFQHLQGTCQPLPPPYAPKTCGSPCQVSPCSFSAQPLHNNALLFYLLVFRLWPCLRRHLLEPPSAARGANPHPSSQLSPPQRSVHRAFKLLGRR